MSQSIAGIQKKRGRPATGRTGIMVKLLPNELAGVDQWRLKQVEALTRPEAIRRLVERALDASAAKADDASG